MGETGIEKSDAVGIVGRLSTFGTKKSGQSG
jgi:hypothetical protein